MTIYQNLKKLLREEKMKEAENLAVMLEQDLLGQVLHDVGYPPGVIRSLTPDFPLVGVASVIASSGQCPDRARHVGKKPRDVSSATRGGSDRVGDFF